MKNPNAFPATNNMSVLLMSSIAVISFSPRTCYGTCLQQLWRHSNTIMIDTLYPISTLNQQLANLEQTHNRCSLHCERWTVKVRIARQLCVLSQKLLIVRTSERNSCYGWRVEWSLEARSNGWNSAVSDELYLHLSLVICFTCLISIVCWCNICCFWNFTLCFFSFMTLSEK